MGLRDDMYAPRPRATTPSALQLTETPDCTPYLLNLGLTKSGTSLVWIAGPISGLIMQPLVGAVADKSTSRFGRRRPFMVAGSLIVATSLLLLGFTREVVSLFLEGEAAAKVTIWLAVLSIWVIDFAINACGSGLVPRMSSLGEKCADGWQPCLVQGVLSLMCSRSISSKSELLGVSFLTAMSISPRAGA